MASRLRLSVQGKTSTQTNKPSINRWTTSALSQLPSALFLASVSTTANHLSSYPAAPFAHFASPGAPSVNETTS